MGERRHRAGHAPLAGPVLAMLVAGCSGSSGPSPLPQQHEHRTPHTSNTVESSGARGPAAQDPATRAGEPSSLSAPREVALPEPAVWVEAFDIGDLCAAVWFDETRRAAWTVSQPAGSGGPSIEAYGIEASFESYRDDAYRLEPTGIAVACSVGSQADLACHYYDCTDLVRTMPPLHCRHRPPPRSRTRSAIQRTHSFVTDRPWWRSGILQGGAIHVCLRRDGEILCYRLERGVEHPTPVSAPALSALRDVRDISGAGAAACAVLGDGSVYCWGAPLVAEPPADGASDAEGVDPASAWTPRRIEGIPPAVQVSVGLRNACARTADGRVFCWGDPRCLIDEVPAEDRVGSTPADAPR